MFIVGLKSKSMVDVLGESTLCCISYERWIARRKRKSGCWGTVVAISAIL